LNSTIIRSSRGTPTISVSWGELIDKITILEIKEKRLKSPEAISNVRRELVILTRVVQGLQPQLGEVDELKRELKSINETLWEVEDRIRAKEASKIFDQKFIELARSIYFNNDKRARIKHQINELLSSEFIEEKQYTPYGT
jgi:uncharacterized protein DUF6165